MENIGRLSAIPENVELVLSDDSNVTKSKTEISNPEFKKTLDLVNSLLFTRTIDSNVEAELIKGVNGIKLATISKETLNEDAPFTDRIMKEEQSQLIDHSPINPYANIYCSDHDQDSTGDCEPSSFEIFHCEM
jgi:hypothetical protein